MADTSIEWADKTWNPLLGCERVSSGCDGCYAITTATIRANNPNPKVADAFAGLTTRRLGQLDWTGRINLLDDRLTQPLGWRKPKRIFVNSQSDLFHKDVPDYFIAKVFAVMSVAQQHTFQLLTKRHARMRSLLSSPEFHRLVADTAPMYSGNPDLAQDFVTTTWPLPNLWLGVSVEDQKRADLRIPALLDTPAAVRWLSCEPLLGPVDLRGGDWDWLDPADGGHENGLTWVPGPAIDWVVVGGESGRTARPMHPAWARSLRDQCQAAGVPFLFKQWGEYGPLPKVLGDGRYSNDRGVTVANDGTVYQPGDLAWPDGPRVGEAIRAKHDKANLYAMYRVGKKTAGRDLDGRTWDEYPADRAAVTA